MVAIGKFFSDRANWQEGEPVNRLVRQYQTTLDSLLESDDKLKRRIKHCLGCGIRFLAAPQNAGREDLRCPFGCAKRHRARQSNERVKAYRRTETGKKKKDALNARRYRSSPSPACESPREDQLAVRQGSGGRLQASAPTTPRPCGLATTTTPRSRAPEAPTTPWSCEPAARADSPLAENATQPLPAELSVAIELDLDGVILDESSVVQSPLLPYIRTLIWMIDGIRLSHVEVAEWLRQVQRQRSMAYRPRRDYVLRFLHQHPP